jgi:hypothetical protein
MNEDLMNRIISQVRMRFVLHCEQTRRGAYQAVATSLARTPHGTRAKAGEKNDRALHLVDAERTEGVDHA